MNVPVTAVKRKFGDVTNQFVRLGNSVYAGGRGTGAGISGGFVVMFDLAAKSATVIQLATNDHMRSFLLTGARVFWIRESATGTTLNIANPLDPMDTGAVAAVPATTFGLILVGSKFYVTSTGATTDLLTVQPNQVPANPPTGTNAMVASIPTCAGLTIAQCAPISSIATDATSLYFSATTAVYKYTAPEGGLATMRA